MSKEVAEKITSDSLGKFHLHFDYNTYTANKHYVANFDIELTLKALQQPYLIINIYDFRDKFYRKRYQCLTDKEYLVELTYPNSGIYIQCK